MGSDCPYRAESDFRITKSVGLDVSKPTLFSLNLQKFRIEADILDPNHSVCMLTLLRKPAISEKASSGILWLQKHPQCLAAESTGLIHSLPDQLNPKAPFSHIFPDTNQ